MMEETEVRIDTVVALTYLLGEYFFGLKGVGWFHEVLGLEPEEVEWETAGGGGREA